MGLTVALVSHGLKVGKKRHRWTLLIVHRHRAARLPAWMPIHQIFLSLPDLATSQKSLTQNRSPSSLPDSNHAFSRASDLASNTPINRHIRPARKVQLGHSNLFSSRAASFSPGERNTWQSPAGRVDCRDECRRKHFPEHRASSRRPQLLGPRSPYLPRN